jgi:hypothetical protein
MPIKIDKNIPIPTFVVRGESGELVHKMQPGDSIFVTERKDMMKLRSAMAVHGFKPVSRKEAKGWRIWKTQRAPGD